MELGTVAQVNLDLVDNIDNWNFDKLKCAKLQEVGIEKSIIYLDKKSSQLFITLDVRDFKSYQKLSTQYQNAWWSHLEPLPSIDGKSLLDYTWHEVFKIEDDE